MTIPSNWSCNIGLEVHIQLDTNSKLFSSSSTRFGAPPNSQACAISLGMPGVLPALNRKAVEMTVKFGLSIQATIAKQSSFSRKNYFYPDLPKNYQITQHHYPVLSNGSLTIQLEDGASKTIHIERAHLEEDAGKSIHDLFSNATALDFNRAGNPLLEIVCAPDLHSAKEAVTYLKKIHTLVRYLKICDGNMQEGSFRCDANVSVKPKASSTMGTRSEIKNLNSFRFLEQAINYEIKRQIELLENGQTVLQETRLYDPNSNQTYSMREKEEAHHYRYFPDPDLLPLEISHHLIETVRQTLPELPWEKRSRLIADYHLTPEIADQLTQEPRLADFFEETVRLSNGSAKLAANWIIGELTAFLNKHNLGIQSSRISPSLLAGLLKRIEDNTISSKIAKLVFAELWQSQTSADKIIQTKNLKQMSDTTTLNALIDEVLKANPSQLADYQAGKTKLFGYFIGQIMKATQGKANPEQINTLLKNKLNIRKS